MSAITPTRLPDPPAAPFEDTRPTQAPVPTQYAAWERAVPVPRPLGALACLILHLPLPLTLTYAAAFLVRHYQREPLPGGLADIGALAALTGATVFVVAGALAATARRLEARVRQRIRIGLAASCLVTVSAIAAVTPHRHTDSTVRTQAGEASHPAERPVEVGHAMP